MADLTRARSVGEERGILSDIQIMRRIVAKSQSKLLFISPVIDLKEQLGPSSLDLRLGTKLRMIKKFSGTHIDLTDKVSFRNQRAKYFDEQIIDSAGHFVLHPGEFALGSTLEYMSLPLDLAGRMEGRSSFGRIGLQVHATAGFVDPGFVGTLTFELMNSGVLPVKIAPGLRLGQICFFRVDDLQVSYMLKPNSKYGGKVDVELSQADKDPEMPGRRELVMDLRGDLSPNELKDFASLLPNRLRNKVRFEGKELDSATQDRAIGEIATVVGGAAAIVSLYFILSDKLRQRHDAKQWSKEKLKSTLDTQLLLYGVIDYEILHVSGFDSMKEGGACKFEVSDHRSNDRYIIHVFVDGDTYVTKVSQVRS